VLTAPPYPLTFDGEGMGKDRARRISEETQTPLFAQPGPWKICCGHRWECGQGGNYQI